MQRIRAAIPQRHRLRSIAALSQTHSASLVFTQHPIDTHFDQANGLRIRHCQFDASRSTVARLGVVPKQQAIHLSLNHPDSDRADDREAAQLRLQPSTRPVRRGCGSRPARMRLVEGHDWHGAPACRPNVGKRCPIANPKTYVNVRPRRTAPIPLRSPLQRDPQCLEDVARHKLLNPYEHGPDQSCGGAGHAVSQLPARGCRPDAAGRLGITRLN